jgi:stage V sporulation protein AF
MILFQVLISEIVIEMVRMASIHTPNSLSQSMGLIVGIVLGGIAVNLGIVSEVIVLLGAVSAIGTYITPSYELALANKIVKILLILVSYFFGINGLVIALILFTIYLATLKSFKMHYLSPLIPFNLKKLIKQFIRLPYKSDKNLTDKENGN